jgi:Tfp pilus assembly protein FimT
LVVIAIMGILMTLAIPAFTALNGSGDLTKGASDIQSFLQEARSQAMARNTYVYVGLQEVDALNPTTSNGVGEIAIAAVASIDGTRALGTTNSGGLTNVTPISKALTLSNIHLTNAASLTSGSNMTGRPGGTTSGIPSADVIDISGITNMISSFQWPLAPSPAHYIFQTVLEFDPQGVPRMQTNPAVVDTSIQSYFEIPLTVAHGDIAVTNSPNQAAIQIDGVTGAVRVYRP